MGVPEKLAGDPLVQHFETLLTRAEFVMIRQLPRYGNAVPLVSAAEEVGSQACVYAFGDDVVFGENATIGLLDVYRKTGSPVLAAQEVDPPRSRLSALSRGISKTAYSTSLD